MKIKALLTVFFICCFVVAANAETTIKAESEKSKISTDEGVAYKVIIASTENALPTPIFPKFTGFAVVSQARSSTVSFMAGGVKTILVYAFILAPMKTGKIKIDPVSIKVKNETLSSNPVEIEVIQGKRRPEQQSNPEPQKKKPVTPQLVPATPQEPQYTL
ncbi:MAG: BatD family protein [Candidatus Omnitrophica bacterium]|nr:BatD family protein [Candidatus Omnitrophota bacterium]